MGSTTLHSRPHGAFVTSATGDPIGQLPTSQGRHTLWPSRSTEDPVDQIGRSLVGGLDELRVDVEGCRGVGVTEAAADRADVDAERQQLSGAEAAEMVELDAFEAELVS